MELFCETGCLTDAALRAVLDGTLNETERLEVSEHMSFCDRCLVRYTDMLTEDTLQSPEKPIAPTVLQRIRQRALRVAVNRYTRVAAVAVLAMALWSTGVFNSLVLKPAARDWNAAEQLSPPSISAGARVNDFFRQTGASLAGAWNGLAERFWPEAPVTETELQPR